MKKIKYLIYLLFIFLVSCSVIDIQDYVHEPTHKLRQSIINSGYTKANSTKNRDLIFVPNFREFSPSFSGNRSSLIVLSKNTITIFVEKAILRAPKMDVSNTINISKKFNVQREVGTTGYKIDVIPLFDVKNTKYSNFQDSQVLELTIVYSLGGNSTEEKSFTLKLITKKDVAWIT